MLSLKNIAKTFLYFGLISAILALAGCKGSNSNEPQIAPVSAIQKVTQSYPIALTTANFTPHMASYKWTVNDPSVRSVEFGSSRLEATAGQPIQNVELDLKQMPPGDQTSASIYMVTLGKYGWTESNTTSNIGTDKGLDVRNLVKPFGELKAVSEGAVLAKGVGAFPSLVVHLK